VSMGFVVVEWMVCGKKYMSLGFSGFMIGGSWRAEYVMVLCRFSDWIVCTGERNVA
jgi:hypothetical protein